MFICCKYSKFIRFNRFFPLFFYCMKQKANKTVTSGIALIK